MTMTKSTTATQGSATRVRARKPMPKAHGAEGGKRSAAHDTPASVDVAAAALNAYSAACSIIGGLPSFFGL